MKDKVKAEIEALFNGKLKRAIAGDVKALQAVQRERAQLQDEIRALEDRAGKAEATARTLAETIDQAILRNETPSKQIREAELRMHEVKSCTAKAELLKNEDLEAQQREKAAQDALSKSLWSGFMSCRDELAGRLRGHLEEVLLTMALFESEAVAFQKAHQVSFSSDMDEDLGRFLQLRAQVESMDGFTQPIGKREAYIRRREVRQKLLG